jgi:hypothetical protein
MTGKSGDDIEKKDGPGKSGLTDFKEMLSDFRSVTTYAVGGAGTVPIVAAMIGIAPPWPPGIGPLTSILVVICLVILYQSLHDVTARRVTVYIAVSAVIALLSVTIYLGLRDIFTFKLPTTGEQIVIGCGYTRDALQVARQLQLEIGEGCPGQFQYLLSTASFDNYRIWTASSLLAVKITLFMSWLLFFFGMTASIGVFIVDQRSRRGRRAGGSRAGNRRASSAR